MYHKTDLGHSRQPKNLMSSFNASKDPSPTPPQKGRGLKSSPFGEDLGGVKMLG